MKLIVLSGLSGAGKTTYRLEQLPDIPYIDMADMYELGAGSWDIALSMAFDRLEAMGGDELILEGYFLARSTSREWVDWLCERNGWEVEYICFDASYNECKKRILAQQKNQLASAKGEEEKSMIRSIAEGRLALLDLYKEI
jgi:predicted kinase